MFNPQINTECNRLEEIAVLFITLSMTLCLKDFEHTELFFSTFTEAAWLWNSLASGDSDIVKIVMVLDKFSNGGKRH